MRAILLTGGVGDIIAIESMMTDEERQSIDCMFYATRAAKPCIELFTNLTTFPKLKKQALLWKNFTNIFGFNSKEQLVGKLCAYQTDELQNTLRKLVSGIEDWSIAKIFFENNRQYTYSSFIKNNLISIKKFNLPKNYYCICPASSNDKRDDKRDYNQTDWQHTLELLKSKNMFGVVINNNDDDSNIPSEHPIINLNNKTNIKEAIEIVKRADGYIGIDTALSVIATKLLPKENIIIKSLNDHCYRWAHIYYTPHKSFEFIKKSI